MRFYRTKLRLAPKTKVSAQRPKPFRRQHGLGTGVVTSSLNIWGSASRTIESGASRSQASTSRSECLLTRSRREGNGEPLCRG